MAFRISNLKPVKYTVITSLIVVGLGTYLSLSPSYKFPKKPPAAVELRKMTYGEWSPKYSMGELEDMKRKGQSIDEMVNSFGSKKDSLANTSEYKDYKKDLKEAKEKRKELETFLIALGLLADGCAVSEAYLNKSSNEGK